MRRRSVLCVAVALSCICFAWPVTGTGQAGGAQDDAQQLPGVELARTFATATGIAVSPLLGVSAVGAWHYYWTPEAERTQLPWFTSPWLWVSGLVLVGLLVFKDFLLGAFPIVKLPFDALELLENKASAVLATPVIITMFVAAFSSGALLESAGQLSGGAGASPQFAAADMTGVLYAVFLLPILVGFYVVWLAAHTINVLIFLSPFGPLDIGLRAIKLGLLGLLVGAAFLHPFAGALVALAFVVVAALLAGWSFRLMVFGVVLAWDSLTLQHRRIEPGANHTVGFTVARIDSVAKRTYGRLERCADGGLSFIHRPWLVFAARDLQLPLGDYGIGRGLLCPILRIAAGGKSVSVLRFAPRYRTHEEWLADHFALSGVEDMLVRRGLKAAFSWLRETACKTGDVMKIAAQQTGEYVAKLKADHTQEIG